MVKEPPQVRRWDDLVSRLTPRQREVVILVGRHRLSYKGAARRLENRYREGEHLTPQTVRQYANQIRDAMESPLSPRDALTELYWVHEAAFVEEAA